LLGYEPFFGKHYRPKEHALRVEFLLGPLVESICVWKKLVRLKVSCLLT
jgi:hypothetical protein